MPVDGFTSEVRFSVTSRKSLQAWRERLQQASAPQINHQILMMQGKSLFEVVSDLQVDPLIGRQGCMEEKTFIVFGRPLISKHLIMIQAITGQGNCRVYDGLGMDSVGPHVTLLKHRDTWP